MFFTLSPPKPNRAKRERDRVIKLLIVDDSPLMRRLMGAAFQSEDDIDLAFARDGVDALDRLHAFKPDVVTLDVNMPNMDGLACLDRIMVERPCPIVMVSSLTESGADVTLQAFAAGAVDFIAKPAGAVSLSMDAFAPVLIEKVRAAAKARLPSAHRLRERVRLRASGAAAESGVRTIEQAPRSWKPQFQPSSESSSAGRFVLVGASTGGPPALDALLSPLPKSFPYPIVVAQHMPASFTGPLARRLDKLCALTVMEVTRPVALNAGAVYIGRGDADIIVTMRAGGPVVLPAPSAPEHRWHPSVDRLVSTAIKALGAERLIGVLMTGMGNDGAAAMTRLSTEGGRTIAESEETAVIWGMPGALVRAGGADIVAPLDAIAGRLLQWAQ